MPYQAIPGMAIIGVGMTAIGFILTGAQHLCYGEPKKVLKDRFDWRMEVRDYKRHKNQITARKWALEEEQAEKKATEEAAKEAARAAARKSAAIPPSIIEIMNAANADATEKVKAAAAAKAK